VKLQSKLSDLFDYSKERIINRTIALNSLAIYKTIKNFRYILPINCGESGLIH